MFEFSRGNYAQKTNEILQATRGLSSTNTEGTHLIECLRSHLKVVTEEMERYYNALTPAQRENLPKPEGVDGEARIGYASSVDGEFPSPPPLKENTHDQE